MDPKRIPRHKKICFKNPDLFFSETPIFLENEEILQKLKNQPARLQKHQAVIFNCKKCGKNTSLKRFSSFDSFTCPRCKTIEVNLERYGTKTPAESDFVKSKMKDTLSKRTLEEIEKSNEKRRETCRKLYGVDAVAQNEEILEKQKDSLSKTLAERNSEIVEKRQKTMMEKHGVKHALQSEIFLRKMEETSKRKFGETNVFRTSAFKEKRKKKCIEKFGNEFPIRTKVVQEKVRKTLSERYGNPNYRNSEKAQQTCLEKFGISHPQTVKYVFQGESFDSGWELALWIWAKDNGISIKREPIAIDFEFEGKKKTYYPDFEIEGKLIEIKGPQFFRDGKLVNPFDESKNDLYEAKHQAAIQKGVEFWSSKEMEKYMDYVEEKYTKDFLKLFRTNIEFPFPNLKNQKSDYDVLRFFHKSIYSASKKNKLSPLEAWENKDLVLKAALNRLKYVGCCSPEKIRGGFTVAQIAPKISVFRPSLAEDLTKKYLQEFSEVFDPFSGFSGRMMGVKKCGKKYIGQDIHPDHVRESNEIIEFRHYKDCVVIQQDILTDKEKTFECLFTCPPYGGKEHWNKNNDEVEKSCDEWIDICLSKYKCKKYLFVVDQTEKYRDKIVETLTNKSHLGSNNEYVVLI